MPRSKARRRCMKPTGGSTLFSVLLPGLNQIRHPTRRFAAPTWRLRCPNPLVHLHHNEGEVVVLRSVLNPIAQFTRYTRGDHVRRQMHKLAQNSFQTILAELLVGGIQRFGYAVSESDQD